MYLEGQCPQEVHHVEDHFEVVGVDGEVVRDGSLGQQSGAQRPHRETQRLVVHHRLGTQGTVGYTQSMTGYTQSMTGYTQSMGHTGYEWVHKALEWVVHTGYERVHTGYERVHTGYESTHRV